MKITLALVGLLLDCGNFTLPTLPADLSAYEITGSPMVIPA